MVPRDVYSVCISAFQYFAFHGAYLFIVRGLDKLDLLKYKLQKDTAS